MKSARCVVIVAMVAVMGTTMASAGTADRKTIKFRGSTGPAVPALAPPPSASKAPAPTAAALQPQPAPPPPVVKPATPKAAKAVSPATNAPAINGTTMTKPGTATAIVGGSSSAPTGILSGSSVSIRRP